MNDRPYFRFTSENAVTANLCPRCGQPKNKHPATSRHDNKTLICSICGVAEAMIAAGATDAQFAKTILAVKKNEQEQ